MHKKTLLSIIEGKKEIHKKEKKNGGKKLNTKNNYRKSQQEKSKIQENEFYNIGITSVAFCLAFQMFYFVVIFFN